MSPDENNIFGPYVLLEKIGRGGMADVYRAERRGVGGFVKRVAIKRILPHLLADEQFVAMFIDEARITASLDHANIVSIHDFGKIDDQLYIVLELIEGPSLAQLLRKMRKLEIALPLSCALYIALETCKGLQIAHERTIDGQARPVIHRDISPQNILLSYDGEVKIADFGVAKTAERLQQTMAHSLKGKLAYMSPEQIEGSEIDTRADIFSTGILLHEMLTGRRLFKGKSEAEVLLKVIGDPVPKPSSVRCKLPPEIDRIVARALERERDKRYRCIGDMGRDISEFLFTARLGSGATSLSELLRSLFASEITTQQKACSNQNIDHGRALMTRLVAEQIGELGSGTPSRESKSAQAHLLVEPDDSATPATIPGQSQQHLVHIIKELAGDVKSCSDVGLWVQVALLARLSLISRRSSHKRNKIISALINSAKGQMQQGDMPEEADQNSTV